MNDFVYHNPCKVYFGEGHLGRLGPEVARLGHRALLVYGTGSVKKTGLFDRVVASLSKAGVTVFELGGVEPNPRVAVVRDGVALTRRRNVDVIVALGGGSVIDTAKAIAVGAFYSGDPWDLVVDNAKITSALPLVAIPTLAGSGSEMNGDAVILNPDTQEVLSLHHELLVPRVAFLQPDATSTAPRQHTAAGAATTFAHLCEMYFSCDRDLDMLDREAEGLMRTVVEQAPYALRHPKNLRARANLLWTSAWASSTFLRGGKTQAWSCLPVSHELEAFYDVTHGAALAIMLPAWMRFCLKRAEKWDKSGDEALEQEALIIFDKFYDFGVNVWGINPKLPKASVGKKATDELESWLVRSMRLPRSLRELGVEKSSLADIAHAAVAHQGGLVDGFVAMSEKDLRKMLKACW